MSASSSKSISPPGPAPGERDLPLRVSLGRLKLVLLLELPERWDMEVPGRPVLENEVRRDDGAEASAPVDDSVIVGDTG